jgi:hypothetical protein
MGNPGLKGCQLGKFLIDVQGIEIPADAGKEVDIGFGNGLGKGGFISYL